MSYLLRGITFSVRGPKPYRRFISLLEAFRRLSKTPQHCDHSHESQSYPDKMAFRQSVVLFRSFFSLLRAPPCRCIPANVPLSEHDQAGLGFLALIYKNVELCDITEKVNFKVGATHWQLKNHNSTVIFGQAATSFAAVWMPLNTKTTF